MKIILPVLLAGLLCVVAIPVASDTPGLTETEYALIWGYGDIQIPEYLAENFDRLFRKLARFFNVNIQDEKILVFVVDFETLQKLYTKENPKVVAAFYDSRCNRIYFTPHFINDYYVTYELLNYFMVVHRETAVPALAKFLVWQGLIEKSIIGEFIIKEEVNHKGK